MVKDGEFLAGKSQLSEIIGVSKPMKELYRILDKLTDTWETILIEGETGTGKELIARFLAHNNSQSGLFIPVDCGALKESLAESEPFGHCKGAFTGAIREKAGFFEEADGGIIFLDEIENLSPSLQAKLLRVLEEKEVRRVGENRLRKIDVQVIASANVDLAKEVAKGNFRQDLYYRLNEIYIKLPPLRDRVEDIPLLVYHFLNQCCKEMKKNIRGISQEALLLLQSYHWPGNVRELKNVIIRAVTLADEGGVIGVDLLPEEIVKGPKEFGESGGSLKEMVEEFEREVILKQLQRWNWNISLTARALSLTRKGLKQKMARYSITNHS